VTGANRVVGLLGLGLVGTALARRLLGAGFEVVGFDVDAAKRDAFTKIGGRKADTVAKVAQECMRILIAVFDTDQVEDVVLGKDGVLVGMVSAPGARVLLNVTTSDPDRIAALAARVAERDVTLLEVPISGTSQQIEKGDGVGLIAGERAAFEANADIFDAICPRRYFVGATGNGGKAKLAVNLILNLNRAALAEGLVFAERLGLDPKSFLEVARGSAAYSQIMDVKGGKMVDRDFAAQGRVTQTLKDVRLMLDYARRVQQALPLGMVAGSLLEGCVAHGEGDWDNCAVIEEIRRRR